MARTLVTAAGAPNLRIVEAAHPLGGLQEKDVLAQVTGIAERVMHLLDIDMPA